MATFDAKDPDLEFALICNSMVQGVVYDEEVRVHQLLDTVYLIESSSDSEEMVSIGLSAIQMYLGDDVELEITETMEINPFRYSTTVVVDAE